MPPKKAPAKAPLKSKAPPRKPTAKPTWTTKPQAKPPTKSTPPLPSTNHKKRKAPADEPPTAATPTPEWDKTVLSQAQRNKRRFKLSMSTMNDTISDVELEALASSLTGSSQETWGVAASGPIYGSRRPVSQARGPFSFGKGSRGGKRGGGGGEFARTEHAYAMMMAHMNGQAARKRVVGVNYPANSPLLRLSIEIRERIYGYLLIYPKPIMVKEDWTTPERNPYISHALMLVCKIFACECTTFLFKNNSVVSLLRAPTHQVCRYEEITPIPDSALSLYRNVILDCAFECWNTDWYEKATLGMQKLAGVTPRPCIESLIMRLSPQKIGFSSTALGMEGNPTTFADFLWFEGGFMQAVCALAPKMLVVVIKKEGRVKLVVKVDMKGLRGRELEGGELMVTEERVRLARETAVAAETQLKGLKGLYEEIFEDHAKVVKEGRCEMLESGEGVAGNEVGGLLGGWSRSQNQLFRSGSGTDSVQTQSSSLSQNQSFRSKSETATEIDTMGSQPLTQEVDDDKPWVFGIQGTVAEIMEMGV